jgi:diguanylate cyclase (GGDEF)-like protein
MAWKPLRHFPNFAIKEFGSKSDYGSISGSRGVVILIVWNFNPYAIALLCTGLLSLALTIQLFLRWSYREGILLGFAMLCIAEWSFFVGFESAVLNPEIKILLAKFSYVGVFNSLPFVLLFVLYYFNNNIRITGWHIVLLWAIPIAIILLAATNESHHLIWSGMVTPPDAIFNTLVYLRGPLYWIEVAYNYVIVFAITYLLLVKYRQSRYTVNKSQSLIVLFSIIPPWIANFFYIIRIPAIRYLDLTPFGIFFTGLILFLGLAKFRLLEIAPVARDILFESLPDGLLIVDSNRALVDTNDVGRTYLQNPYENWMGVSLDQGLIDIPDLTKKLNAKKAFLYETHHGESETIEVDGRPITDLKKGFAGWMITIRDISFRKELERAEVNRRQFAEALSEVSLAVNSSLNLTEVLERILSSVFELFPCTMANIALIDDGVAHVEVFHGYISTEEQEWVRKAKFNVDDVYNLKMMRDTGKPMYIADTRKVDYFTNPNVFSYMGAPIKVKNKVIGFLNLDSDQVNSFHSDEECERLKAFADLAGIAIDNARLYQKMAENAIMDSLTGINNRRNLLHIAEKEFERSRRYNTPISIIMLDLDNFKLINDTRGHQAGDMVLADVGKTLSMFIRKIDTAGRYGGDEFCIILPETGLEDARAAAERLLEEFHKVKVPRVSKVDHLEASVGVACKSESAANLEDLLARADLALYQAKKLGRNRVETL